MEQLTWTGSIGNVLDPFFLAATGVLILSLVAADRAGLCRAIGARDRRTWMARSPRT